MGGSPVVRRARAHGGIVSRRRNTMDINSWYTEFFTSMTASAQGMFAALMVLLGHWLGWISAQGTD